MTDQPDEFTLIHWIRKRAGQHPQLQPGIGDDAACIRFADTGCLVTVDMLMEGVHFTIPPATPVQIGRKAMAVNLSDMAAMAGKPTAAFVSLALPQKWGFKAAQELHAGLQTLADEYEVAIAGGDTNSWDGPLVISVTLLGEADNKGPVLRSGAQAGDWVLVTGSLGGSLCGRHLDFPPRVAEARLLHDTVTLHSMIDVSDGLIADLTHLTEESGVGAVLEAPAIPISEVARAMHDDRSPLEHALGDGEDFELLFTVSPAEGRRLLDNRPFDTSLTRVGEIVAGAGIRLRDARGHEQPATITGWRHAL